MRQTNSILRLSSIGLLALACGGTTQPAPSSSDVPGNTALSAVGPAEAASVCNWYFAMMSNSPYVRSVCQQFGVIMARSSEADTSSNAAVQSGCSAAQAGCTTKMQEDMVQMEPTCATSLDQSTCSATVADFEACSRAMAQLSFSGLPACNELTVNFVFPASSTDPALPAACVELQSACPEVIAVMRLTT